MTVTRAALNEALAEVQADCPFRSDEGLFGPGSATWRISRESIVFLGGGCAALLQLAHPYVAHAVDQHSKTRNDPIGRFNRTFMHVFSMVFGSQEDALRAARRVHNIHVRIEGAIEEDVGCFLHGHRYEANDEDALLWVHATLVHTSLHVYDLVLGPLSEFTKAQYYDESKVFARLFGIPDVRVPETLVDFERYVADMVASDTLTVGAPARDIAGFLMKAPNPIARPFARWYSTMTAGLLPERFRHAFGLRFGNREDVLFRASLRGLRTAYPAMPRRLRYLPAYVEAVRRLSGQTGPDRFGRALERLVLRGVKPSKSESPSNCPLTAA